MKRGATLHAIYRRLFATYGPRHWWPAQSPFEVMVGAVLTQNTAWVNVEKAITNLKRARVLSPKAIIDASPAQLGGWLRPSGFFNVKAARLGALCRWLLSQGGMRRVADMPTDALRTELLAVHGIGPETADDILLYAFARPVFVIDEYTRRTFGRLGIVAGGEGYETLRGMFEGSLGRDARLFNEYHALIVTHGKDVCRSQPHCGRCCLWRRCPSRQIAAPARRSRQRTADSV